MDRNPEVRQMLNNPEVLRQVSRHRRLQFYVAFVEHSLKQNRYQFFLLVVYGLTPVNIVECKTVMYCDVFPFYSPIIMLP